MDQKPIFWSLDPDSPLRDRIAEKIAKSIKKAVREELEARSLNEAAE